MIEKYPVGIQTFSEVIRHNAVYVDKTAHILSLLTSNTKKSYFLSRPRRFGKSLLISTLKALFEGKQPLFQGLYIYDKMEWKTYPIIHLSMSDINFENLGLEKALKLECNRLAKKENVELVGNKSPLRELLEALYLKYEQQVVILIDEYDKPIIHGLEAGNSSEAEKNRDIMKSFYGGLKDADAQLRFLFITGVSKFAKVSIFSDLNHLTDISLDENYATLCGYTQEELEHYFPQGIEKLAKKYGMTQERCLAKIKDWYDGFSWDGENFMYNPFSTLQLFSSSQFSNYWFST
ncbi:MAG: AAA family ATPase, partial [Bacteroidia bacterium]